MSEILRYPAYIGGEDVEHPEGRYVHTVTARAVLEDTFGALALKRDLDTGRADPRSAGPSVVGACALADDAMAHRAVEAAARAAPDWARVPLRDRVAVGVRIGERLREKRDDLVDLLVAEGQPRALAGPTLDEYWYADFSAETLNWCAGQMESSRHTDNRHATVRRVPDGVVCVNPPQNASTPNALFGVTALIAGNAVVVRAPRGVPLATTHTLREVVVPVLEEAGAPPGVLNILCGPPMTGLWLDSPHVDDIVYVGGSAKGFDFERAAVTAGKKPILELAGNDCCVVWRDADLDSAVASITENFRQSGQICNIPNQVVAHPAIADELLDRLTDVAARTKPGYPDDPDTVLTPVLMAEAHFADIADAVGKGARLLHGGRRLEVDGKPSDTGLFVEPAVLRVDGLRTARETRAVREETFSPLVPVVVPEPGDNDDAMLDDVLRFVGENAYGLRNSFWARDERVVRKIAAEVTNCGVVNINDSHSAFRPFLPTHGGTGLTGGTFGEANYLMLRTTRLQGVNIVGGRK
ncbi:aldehyde dehydrogenase family protein [Amycolatopsis sp. NPDC051071]|uniref:aldehyde dehydrogenase family protein n=1 Tax=Amycolatopsis sp. NPDC051071 TaxID=3154637 RepID=UPI00341C8C6B